MIKTKRVITHMSLVAFVGFPLSMAAGYGLGRIKATAENPQDNASASLTSSLSSTEQKSARGKPGSLSRKPGAPGTAFSSQREWIERIRHAEAAEFPDLWKEIMGISDQYQRRAPRELLYQKWVTLDGKGCMDFITKTDNGQRTQVMTAWVKQDAEGAYAWALASGDENTVKDSARMVFQQLAQTDPRKFLAMAASAKEDYLPSESIQAAFRKFAKTDPAGAAETLKGLGSKARNNGSWGLGVEWARKDPGSAFTWAQQLSDPVEKQSALRGVLSSWAKTDPDAVISRLGLIEQLPDVKGEDPKGAIVRGLASKDPRRAMDFVTANVTNQNERLNLLGGEVLPKLAATMKPADLVALLDRKGLVKGSPEAENSSYGDLLFTRDRYYGSYNGDSVFEKETDPAGSFRQLTGGDLTAAGKFAATAMAQQWVLKDQAGALSAYQSAPAGESKDLLSAALMGRAYAENDLALLTKIEGGFSDKFREGGGVNNIIRQSAWSDPAKLLTWADQLPADSKSSAPARTAAVGAWAAYDTASALTYAEQRPAEEQPKLFNAISSAWAAGDTYGNSQWVASLPEGPNRDNAASGLIQHLSKEPLSALEWARSIGDQTIRDSSYENLFVNWAARDSDAALQALQAENLPPEKKTKIEKVIKDNTRR